MSLFQNFKYFWDGDWLPNELPLYPAMPISATEPKVRTPRLRPKVNSELPTQFVNGLPTPASTRPRPQTTLSGKRPASPRPPLSPPPSKKASTSNGRPVRLRLLRKQNGKSITTRKIINPEGVLAGRISKRFPSTLKSSSSKGFPNPGNRCYRNAALQGLLHVPAVYHLLGNIHRDCDKSLRQCVTCALQDLCQRYWSLKSVKGARKTLDYPDLDTAILRDIPRTPIKADGTLHDLVGWHNGVQDDSMLYYNVLEKHITKACDDDDLALLNQVLKMKRKAVWTCSACGETHRSSEQSSSFVVPLDTPKDVTDKTLVDMIHYNLFTEQVRLRCETETCRRSRAQASIPDDADMPFETRKYHITKAPECLIVMQKRFIQKEDASGNAMFHNENGKKVPTSKKLTENTFYEEYLNLGRYTEDDNELFYRLDAVVGHAGESVNGGHYITGVREANGVDFAMINDSKVALGTSPQLLERVFWEHTEFEPYIMFYSKV